MVTGSRIHVLRVYKRELGGVVQFYVMNSRYFITAANIENLYLYDQFAVVGSAIEPSRA